MDLVLYVPWSKYISLKLCWLKAYLRRLHSVWFHLYYILEIKLYRWRIDLWSPYLENKGKYILEAWRHAIPKDVKRRERESAWEKAEERVGEHGREAEREIGGEGERQKGREAEKERGPQLFGFSFYMFFFFFLLSLGLPYVNWTRQECCLFCLKSLLWSLDLPLFYRFLVF